uniref:DUF2971 domain-containing protein n=1 Tax=Rhodopseudomonas palustris (strain BisA53) TaxID=316055 RepID=Q07LK3_RHOP5
MAAANTPTTAQTASILRPLPYQCGYYCNRRTADGHQLQVSVYFQDSPRKGTVLINMSNDHVEKIISEMKRFDGRASPMPRWFGAKREASFAMLRRFYHTAPPSRIYHYTSSAALISIIVNNELWLSEATYLNDRHEIELGRRQACDRIKARIAAEPSAEVSAMLGLSLSHFDRRADPQVYVVCFSFEDDDLTQWRAYGSSGAPVAIELEHSPLMFGYTSEGMLDRVMHDSEDQLWVFDRLITAYADAYREDIRDPIPVRRRDSPLTLEEENEIVATSLYHALWHYIVTCKDPAFATEREVRFIYTAHDFSQDERSRSWYPEHPKPRFRERAGRVIPYLTSSNLAFSNMDRIGEVERLPIRSVRIGPTAEPTLIQRGIRRLLDTHGYQDATVTVSTSPFRPG